MSYNIRKRLIVTISAVILLFSVSIAAGAAEGKSVGTNPIPGGVENLDIFVNQEKLETLPAYVNMQWKVMVPLRSIAHALGYEMVWDSETQTIDLGQQVILQIGKDHYALGSETVLVDGSTYVPLAFFQQVLGVEHVDVSQEGIFLGHKEPTLSSDPPVEQLEHKLASILNTKTASNMGVTEYASLADIESAISTVMTQELAAIWVDDFFREEDGNVYKLERDTALLIDFNEQYYLGAIGENKYELMQEHRSQLRGHIMLKVVYEWADDEWIMTYRSGEFYKPEMAGDVPPSIWGMEQEFEFTLLMQAGLDGRIHGYHSLEMIRNALMNTMTQALAEEYVALYYREEADGIYVNSIEAPIVIDFDLPYELKEDGDDRFVLTQEQESMLHGHVELQVTYEKFVERGWLMTSRESVRKDETKAEKCYIFC